MFHWCSDYSILKVNSLFELGWADVVLLQVLQSQLRIDFTKMERENGRGAMKKGERR